MTGFPYAKTKAKAVQPDNASWQCVRVGMSRDEVIGILGEPLERETVAPPYYSYGYIELPLCPRPRMYRFLIGYDDHGTVIRKQDPFNGQLSTDGKPSKPELIIPMNEQVFAHYPRVLDLRWFPVSGVYPITYAVEVGSFPYPEVESAPPGLADHDEVVASELVAPYFATEFVGANPGRVRVKAKNEVGVSKWSDFRCFRFTV